MRKKLDDQWRAAGERRVEARYADRDRVARNTAERSEEREDARERDREDGDDHRPRDPLGDEGGVLAHPRHVEVGCCEEIDEQREDDAPDGDDLEPERNPGGEEL